MTARPLSLPPAERGDRDFFFIGRDDPVAARDTIVELVAERIPDRFGFDPRTEIQVLSPMHRGELGTFIFVSSSRTASGHASRSP